MSSRQDSAEVIHLASPAQTMAGRLQEGAAPSRGDRAEAERLGAATKAYLKARRLREDRFPADLFADPAWDILLDLFVCQIDGIPVGISDACVASQVPNSTALRWIARLEDLRLVVRASDPQDGRRAWLSLDRKGYAQMWDWAASTFRATA